MFPEVIVNMILCRSKSNNLSRKVLRCNSQMSFRTLDAPSNWADLSASRDCRDLICWRRLKSAGTVYASSVESYVSVKSSQMCPSRSGILSRSQNTYCPLPCSRYHYYSTKLSYIRASYWSTLFIPAFQIASSKSLPYLLCRASS